MGLYIRLSGRTAKLDITSGAVTTQVTGPRMQNLRHLFSGFFDALFQVVIVAKNGHCAADPISFCDLRA